MSMFGNRLMSGVVVFCCLLARIGFSEDAVQESSPPAKAVAVFTANRGDKEMNDQMPVFEDMLTAQVTDLGLGIISREVVVGAVGDLLKQDEDNKFVSAVEKLLKGDGKTDLDSMLGDQTSALRLAQNLGADYLLFASFMGMDEEIRHVNAYDVEYDNYIYTLRASYRVLDGNTGASLTAGMVEPSRTIQQTKHSQTITTGLVRELLSKACSEIGNGLQQKLAEGKVGEVSVNKELVEFSVTVSLNDVNFPQAEILSDGRVKITANQATVQPLAVPVELDGFMIGTTGSGDLLTKLKASPGLHRVRLSRDDLEPFERMVNIYDGMVLNIAMQLNAEGLKRWKENTKTFNELLKETKLNDAEVEAIKGYAQQLRQSGYKVDIKVDTDEAITVNKTQSIMNQE